MGDKVDIDEIRRQVEERKAEEAAELGTAEAPSDDGISSRFALECLQANERGDGLLFSELHRGKYLFDNGGEKWLRWAGEHWDLDLLGDYHAAVEAVALRYAGELPDVDEKIGKAMAAEETALAKRLISTKKKLEARIDKLRSDAGITKCLRMAARTRYPDGSYPLACRGDEFDRRPLLLACPNGVVDLQTGKLRPGRPDQYLLKATKVPYLGLDAKAPTFERFLEEIQPGRDATVAFLRRAFGYAITGLNVEHDFYCFYGPRGRNGKGTLIETIKEIMGPLASPIPAEMLMDQGRVRSSAGPSPDMLDLCGLRLAWASETDRGSHFSAGVIKRLTGGDSLKARAPHAPTAIEWEPTHTLFLLTNDRPTVHGDDEAFWARMKLILFPVHYVKNRAPDLERLERKADPYLRQKLREEAPGILAWLVRGCMEWQQHGLAPPPEVIADTRSYQEDEDVVLKWVSEECDTSDPGIWSQASALYESFKEWYTRSGMGKQAWGSRTFYEALGRKFSKDRKASGVGYYGIRIAGGF